MRANATIDRARDLFHAVVRKRDGGDYEHEATRTARIPNLNEGGFNELKLLQARLIACDGQLRNFTPLRDRLVASGQSCQAMQTEVRLDFPGLGDSYITPMSNNIPGRINFNYTPQWEVLA